MVFPVFEIFNGIRNGIRNCCFIYYCIIFYWLVSALCNQFPSILNSIFSLSLPRVLSETNLISLSPLTIFIRVEPSLKCSDK